MVLDGVETAAVAEAWASSAVAEWAALGGRIGALAPQLLEHPTAEKVVAWVEGGEPPGGQSWLGDVGTYEPVGAWLLADPAVPGERGLIVTYESAGGDRHDVSVTVVDQQLLSVVAGPEGLAEAAQLDNESSSDLAVTSTTVPDAVGVIRAAVSHIAAGFSVVSEASLPLLLRRLGLPATIGEAQPEESVEIPPRDSGLEAYGADVLRSALREELTVPAPDAVQAAFEWCRERFAADDPDALTLAAVAGVPALCGDSTIDDLCRLVSGYFAPVSLAQHPLIEQESLIQLEVADWIGVILGLARSPVGVEVDGAMLVGLINKAPEITTTIPKKHAAELGWTFETMLYAWELTGVLVDGAVGPAAKWLLPRAAIQLWGDGSG